MFGVGQHWIPYSWSNEILFAWLDKTWGLKGLLIAQASLAVILVFLFMWVASKIARDYFFGALLGIFIATASQSHYTLRPQSLTWGLLVLMLLVADVVAREGLSKGRIAAITVLSSLWANAHITAILGVGMAALWALDNTRSKGETLRHGFGVFFSGVVGCFLTPHFGAEIITLLSKAGHPMSFTTVAEFQPAQITHYSVAILVIGLSLFCLFLHLRPKSLSLSRIIVVSVTTVAGLAVVKFLPMAAVALALGLATMWRERATEPSAFKELGEAFTKLSELYQTKLKGQGLAVLLVALVIIQFSRLSEAQKATVLLPTKAVDFMIENNMTGPVLNLFGDGGYLMYRYSDSEGNPKMLVPIDGRTNVIPPELMVKYGKALRGQLGWHEYIDAVKPETILWRTEGPLVAILNERKDWKMVYKDGTDEKGHVVFQRVP